MESILIYIFIAGLCIGSFLNVCIDRIVAEKSIVWPPSHCNSCGYELSTLDLIPVISYIFLRGRCRKCHKKITFQYPVIEVLNAVLYTGVYHIYGVSFYFFKYSLLISILIVTAVIDIKTKSIYTKVSIFAIVCGIFFDLTGYFLFNIDIFTDILGALIGFIVFYVIVKATKAMGKGDIDVAVFCGLFLGRNYTILTIILSFILGGIAGCFLMIFKKKKRNVEMPLAPCLALGALVSVFFGDLLINWYISL